jgi:putative ATPase
MDLFSSIPLKDLPGTPLAEKLRPETLAQILGQPQVLSQVERYVASGFLPNLIFWGPPGTGKTSLAFALAKQFNAHFVSINAVESGAKALKEIGEAAKNSRRELRQQTVLFVDEIHRFNKAQQDVLLPFIEKGDVVLIGATTENPSYELNRALLSRCRLLVFKRHSQQSLKEMIQKAFQAEDPSLKSEEIFTTEGINYLISWSDGDARRILLALEEIFSNLKAKLNKNSLIGIDDLKDILGRTPLGYDKQSDQHYDVISAFIKAVRGSDADAALYYLARMIKGGEDPVFIARRLIVLASEDIGNADPRALQVAVSGAQAVEIIGLPEGAITLAQVVTYLSSAPKSNRSYLGLKRAQEYVEKTGTPDIALALRSSKTAEMKKIGYGVGYQYPHDFPKHWVEQSYWPQDLKPEKFYEPDEIGFEKQILEYLRWLKK